MKINQQETAVRVYHEGHRTMERRVLEFVRDCGNRGATILEIAEALGVGCNCVTGRLTDLAKAGRLVVLPAKRHCDINGRRKIVWAAVVRCEQVPLWGAA